MNTINQIKSFFTSTIFTTVVLMLVFTVSAIASDNWYIGNYVDDFGDPTGEHFLGLKTTGTFSNSATTNSKLTVQIIVDKSGTISIMLYEYGSQKVSSYSHKFYTIKFQGSNKKTKELSATLYENTSRIIISSHTSLYDLYANGNIVERGLSFDLGRQRMKNYQNAELKKCGDTGLHDALLSSKDVVKVRIYENNSPTNYSFNIIAVGYTKAFNSLKR